jgi:MFS transporter, DHA1 family, inner membrane transport protein
MNRTETPRRVLPALVLAQLAGTSPWFAVNAVMPELQRQNGWALAELAGLSSAVQWGFIAGTMVFALLALADRIDARKVFLCCALASAACTLVSAQVATSLPALWWARAANGFFLAGIYPVGMKLAALWFPRGLGAALGWLIGALVLGSASAHAVRALGAQWPWQGVFFAVAGLSLCAGLLVWWAVPQPTQTALPVPAKPWRVLPVVWREAQLRASVLGYFGHMWELYSFWVLVPVVLAARLQGAALSATAFFVLGAGAIGCIGGGYAALRVGSARVATVQLGISGACALASPWMLAAPDAAFYAWLVLWGITVAGDSPQFSTLTASNAPKAVVGSVLTLTNCVGFAISAGSIQLFAGWLQTHTLGAVLPWLALGPALGVWAMWRQARQPFSPLPRTA